MPLSALIEEAVAPHRNFGVAVGVTLPPDLSTEPVGDRNPAIRYGLGNLLENAVDFANRRVEVIAQWDDDEVNVTISDDGPGFAPEVIARVGAPYVTHRRPEPGVQDTEGDDTAFGLGLGFFIAKTLLERYGAKLSVENVPAPGQGAVVKLTWNRADFERPLLTPALELGLPAS
jgi:two-component system sensor histidine kinase RegB